MLQYSNSPTRDFERLNFLLNEMILFGLIHEDYENEINLILCDLHKKIATKLSKEVYGYPDETIPFSELFLHVPAKDKPFFIQDLRNAIESLIYRSNGGSKELKNMRSMEQYKNNISIVEDTDFLKKHIKCQRSAWFPPEVHPSQIGIYEISYSDEPKHSGFSYWDGKTWYEYCILFNDCLKQNRNEDTQIKGGQTWRGFISIQNLDPSVVTPVISNSDPDIK